MRLKKLLLCSLILLCVAAPSYAQLWSGILDPSRAINWGAGNKGIAGGIPNRTTICQTLNPGVTFTQINNAIAACPSNQVVFLNAGTYTLSSGINFGSKSNVTLRGAGPDQTIVRFNAPDGCNGFFADICIQGQDLLAQLWGGHTPSDLGQIHNWTAGYTKEATVVTVDSTSGLSVGMTIVLDQLDDTSETGGVLVSGNAQHVLQNVSTGRPGRGQMQFVTITAISGTQLTISPGLYMPNWRASQSPQIWWINPVRTLNGIENMTLDHQTSSSVQNLMAGIVFWNTTQCWVKNVRSLTPGRNHVWLVQAARSEVRDNYFYGIASGGGSLSYGIDFYMGGDSLIINNIFQHVTAPLLPGGTSGDVIAYNFAIDHPYSTPDWMQITLNGHQLGQEMILYEGNQGNGIAFDIFHGAGEMSTVFRNYLRGRDLNQTMNTLPIQVWAYNRFLNLIGNVLGTPGYHTVYEQSSVAGSNDPWHSIYLLGYSASGTQNDGCCAYDPLVRSTMLRWGNYDTATGTVRFLGLEIPTLSFPGGVNGNLIPLSQILPASLFLTSQPSWWVTPWGTPAWPAVGPQVTGGNVPGYGGRVWKNPAQLCYDNSPQDGGNPYKRFIATTCYGTGGTQAPSPPKNLRIN